MKRERGRSPAPTAALCRLEKAILLLQNRGIPEQGIDAYIRGQILLDIARARERRQQPSLN